MTPILSVVVFCVIIYKFITYKESDPKTMEDIRTKSLDKNYHN